MVLLKLVGLLLCSISLDAATTDDMLQREFWDSVAEKNLRRKLKLQNGRRPKNVILFVGDGMGIPVTTGARWYKNQENGNAYLNEPLFFETFSYSGHLKTSSYDAHVTDSAAGGMALFSGWKVNQRSVGLKPGKWDETKKFNCSIGQDQNINDGIADLAVEKGVGVGFVTTDTIVGATPAAFYAKGTFRYARDDGQMKKLGLKNCEGREIALQLLNKPANQFKVIFGGGEQSLAAKGDRSGKREDGRNIFKEWKNISENHKTLRDLEGFQNHEVQPNEQLLGIFAENGLPYVLDSLTNKTSPSLVEMTEKAIKRMEMDNEKGYFLVVEGENIDKAQHANILHQAFTEVIELDDAVKKAREMTNPEETLIIVLADHSHALAIPGYVRRKDNIMGTYQKANSTETDGQHIPGFMFVAGDEKNKTPLNYTKKDYEDKNFKTPIAIPYLYGVHGGEDIPVWSDGPSSWLFTGSMENTEIAYYIKYLLRLNEGDEDTPKGSGHMASPLVGKSEIGENNQLLVDYILMLLKEGQKGKLI